VTCLGLTLAREGDGPDIECQRDQLGIDADGRIELVANCRSVARWVAAGIVLRDTASGQPVTPRCGERDTPSPAPGAVPDCRSVVVAEAPQAIAPRACRFVSNTTVSLDATLSEFGLGGSPWVVVDGKGREVKVMP